MRSMRRFVVAGFLLIASAGLGQSTPDECDSTCLALREIINAGPGKFQSIAGTQYATLSGGNTYYNSLSKVQLPGFSGVKYDRCYVEFRGFRCIKGFQDRAAADHLAETIATAVEHAEKNWRMKRLYFSETQSLQFCSQAFCSYGGNLCVFVAPWPQWKDNDDDRSGPPQVVEVALNSVDITQQAVDQGNIRGTLAVQKAPPDANVVLEGWWDGERHSYDSPKLTRKGTTDASGNLTFTDLPPDCRYHLAITKMAHKPLEQELTIKSSEPQVVEAQLEPGPLTEAEVEDGLQKGIPTARMKELVSQFGVDFAFDDAAEKRLRAAGADDSLLVMIAKSKK